MGEKQTEFFLSSSKRKASMDKGENKFYIPQKFRLISSKKFNECEQQVEQKSVLTIENLLNSKEPIVFSGSKGQGKTALAKKIMQNILESHQDLQITPLFLSKKTEIQFDFTQILNQQLALLNESEKRKIIEKDVIDDKLKMIIIIDDFDDILLNNKEFLNIQHQLFIQKCKFIYFVNTSLTNNQDYQRWIEFENIQLQYEIMQFKKNDIQKYFENYLPDQCISDIDLSLNEYSGIIKSIVEKIKNDQNAIQVFIKIIKLSSIVDDFEQYAGNAMTILKELNRIFEKEDFSFIRLKNSTFDYVSFINCNFEGSQMENVNISRCWFIQCNLNNVAWKNMVKEGVQLNIGQEVKFFAFSNDNQIALMGLGNQRIEMWHMKSCKILLRKYFVKELYTTAKELYVSAAITTNGKIFASCKFSKIQIYSSYTGKIVRQIEKLHRKAPIAISHNNKILAYENKENVELYDLIFGKLSFQFSAKAKKIYFSSNDKLIATCNNQSTLSVWNDKEKRYQLITEQGYKDSASISISSDTRRLAYTIRNYIAILDLHSKTEMFYRTNLNIKTMQFSPNGKQIVYGSRDGNIAILSINNEITQNYDEISLEDDQFDFTYLKKYSYKGILAISFQSNGTNLVTGNREGKMQLYDYKNIKERKVSSTGYNSIAFSPSGNLLAYGDWEQEKIFIWDFEQQKLVVDFITENDDEDTDSVSSITFSYDGQLLAYSFQEMTKIWSLKSRLLIFEIEDAVEPVFSPTELKIAALQNQFILIWSVEENQVNLYIQIKIDTELFQIVYSPCGTILASYSNHEICFWDAQSGICKKQFKYPQDIKMITFSPDGGIFASILLDPNYVNFWGRKVEVSTLCLWDVKNDISIQFLELNETPTSISFSPNGELLALGMIDSRIQFMNILQQKASQNPVVLKGHSLQVNQLNFSHDGTMLASCGLDGSIKIWRIQIEEVDADSHQSQLNIFDQQKCQNYKITPFYVFIHDFELNTHNSTLTDASIVSNKGVNLIQLFLQMGGSR